MAEGRRWYIRCTYRLGVWVWRQQSGGWRLKWRILKKRESGMTSWVTERIVLRQVGTRMLLALRKKKQCINEQKCKWDEGKIALTVCCMKNSHFGFCVVFQSRNKSICLSVLIVFLIKSEITQGSIPGEPRLLHWWCMPSRRQGRGEQTIGVRCQSLEKPIPKQLSVQNLVQYQCWDAHS